MFTAPSVPARNAQHIGPRRLELPLALMEVWDINPTRGSEGIDASVSGALGLSSARALIVLLTEQNVSVPVYFSRNNYGALWRGTRRVIRRVWTEGCLI